MNRYYAELSESDFKTLSLLKKIIESYSQYSIEYRDALHAYTDFLLETINDLSDPLPPELEIDQKLLPQDYIDFKVSYSIDGPYTLKKRYKANTEVCLIEVLSVSIKDYGSEISAKILKSYKQSTDDLILSFFSSSAWGYPRFKKFEVCIVFLDRYDRPINSMYPEYRSSGYETKMEIVKRENSKMAISPKLARSFWGDLGVIRKENHIEMDFKTLDQYLESLSDKTN